MGLAKLEYLIAHPGEISRTQGETHVLQEISQQMLEIVCRALLPIWHQARRLPPLERLGRATLQLIARCRVVLTVRCRGIALQVPALAFGFWRPLLRDTYEPYTTDLFLAACRRFPRPTIVDVGAHVGYYTILAAKANPDATIWALEPEPYNFSLLCRNIRMNRCSNVRPLKKAAHSNSGTGRLYLDTHATRGWGRHSTRAPTGERTPRPAPVHNVALDELLENDTVQVVKIDVEGAEPYVVGGMEKTLRASPEVVVFVELNPSLLPHEEALGLLRRLQALAFDLYLIDDSRRCASRLTPERLRHIEQAVNVLALKGQETLTSFRSGLRLCV